MEFEEVQRFRQRWLYGVLSGSVLAVLYAFLVSTNLLTGSVLAMVIMVSLLVFSAKLRTRVEENAVSVRFFPFHLSSRRFSYEEIEDFRAEEYSPIGEFGGWGLRWIPFAGKIAYNVTGDRGVRLELEDGREVMIGSRRAEELEEAIEKEVT